MKSKKHIQTAGGKPGSLRRMVLPSRLEIEIKVKELVSISGTHAGIELANDGEQRPVVLGWPTENKLREILTCLNSPKYPTVKFRWTVSAETDWQKLHQQIPSGHILKLQAAATTGWHCQYPTIVTNKTGMGQVTVELQRDRWSPLMYLEKILNKPKRTSGRLNNSDIGILI